MTELLDTSTDFANAIAAIAKDRFVDRLWQRDGTLFCASDADQATARAARDGMGWIFDGQVLRDAVDQLAILARVVERLRYDRVVVVAPPPIAAWCDAVGRHLRGRRGLPVVALWGNGEADVTAALDDGKATKPLWVLVATADSPNHASDVIRALGVRWCLPDDCVAIAPSGSELDRQARKLGFREVFALPADVGARFAAVTMATLVPAALAGVVLHDALSRAEDMLDQCRDLAPDLNPGVRLGAWLWANGQHRRHLYLGVSKDCRGFSDWVAHAAAVPGATGLWPAAVTRAGADPAWWAERSQFAALVSVSTFAHPDDNGADAARAAHVPDEAFVLPEPADWWAEAIRWQFALATWGHLTRCNPFAAGSPTSAGGTQAPAQISVASLAALPRAMADRLANLGAGDRVLVTVALPATTQMAQRLDALRDTLGKVTTAAVVVTHPGRWPAATMGPLPAGVCGIWVRVATTPDDGPAPLYAVASQSWQVVDAFLASGAEPA